MDIIKKFFSDLWKAIKTNNSTEWTSFLQGLIHALVIALPIGMVLSEAIFKSSDFAHAIAYQGVWVLAIAQVAIILIYFFKKK